MFIYSTETPAQIARRCGPSSPFYPALVEANRTLRALQARYRRLDQKQSVCWSTRRSNTMQRLLCHIENAHDRVYLLCLALYHGEDLATVDAEMAHRLRLQEMAQRCRPFPHRRGPTSA